MASRSMLIEHPSFIPRSLIQHLLSARHWAKLWECTPTRDYVLLFHGPDHVSSILETPSRNLQEGWPCCVPSQQVGLRCEDDGSLSGEEKASGRKRSLRVTLKGLGRGKSVLQGRGCKGVGTGQTTVRGAWERQGGQEGQLLDPF